MNKDCLWIKGGRPLNGSVYIQGSKNACLPLIAAAVRTGSKCVLLNVPKITDVFRMINLFCDYGVNFSWEENTLSIDASNIQPSCTKNEIACEMRASSYMIGALLPTLKEISLPFPGGCKIGERPLDIHFHICEEIGASVFQGEKEYTVVWKKKQPKRIKLRFASVGATINGILLATGVLGETVLENAACEPEVDAVIHFLTLSGAKIHRKNNVICVFGGRTLRNIEYSVPFDRIVAGDILLSIAATKGEGEIIGVKKEALRTLLVKLSQTPCQINIICDRIYIRNSGSIRGCVFTAPYPAFPTDLQAQFVAACFGSGGECGVVEHVFGSRFGYAKELAKMGANIRTHGDLLRLKPSVIHSAETEACDLRSSMALIIAGLCAKGDTKVKNLFYLDRGYSRITEVLTSLGGDVKRYNER